MDIFLVDLLTLLFFSYLWPLKKMLNTEKPDYLIVQLITSLPLFLKIIFNFETKLILRISGYPKMNFLRKFFFGNWSLVKFIRSHFHLMIYMNNLGSLTFLTKKK